MVIELLAESSGEREVKNQVQSYNYTTELTQGGQWSYNTAPLRAWMLQSRTWTWSLLLPPPSQERMIQHGPFFLLSPASHSGPRADTYDEDFPAHGTHAPVAMDARKCHIWLFQRWALSQKGDRGTTTKTRIYHNAIWLNVEWSNPEREKQISYINAYMWNLKKLV